MRAVIVEMSEPELERRRKTGLDRLDEVWEGVSHMAPAPSTEHQRIVGRLIECLGPRLRESGRGTLLAQISVFDEPSPTENYRIPDLTFVARERIEALVEDGVRGGGPDAVIEVRSAGDETYEKLPFYAKVGTQEVVVIDRDTKRVEVFRLAGESFLAVSADADGWVVSEVMGVELRGGEGGVLELVDRREPGGSVTI
ncbi:MAG: Uma2 family endonuclease [Acidimicrobiia bacterium]